MTTAYIAFVHVSVCDFDREKSEGKGTVVIKLIFLPFYLITRILYA